MSSAIDPAKLKVVDLRQELSNRGLDSKGNKAVLVKRLKDALEKELKQEIPDTSIADTSTEDLDTSVNEENDPKEVPSTPKEVEKPPPAEEPAPPAEKMEVDDKPEAKVPEKVVEEPTEKPNELPVPQEETKIEENKVEPSQEEKTEENGEHKEQEEESKVVEEDLSSVTDSKPEETNSKPEEETKTDDDSEPKGEKRKREDASPDRSQKKRERSPIKEDEPAIDGDKVQLSWYDSDLHLHVDKESFLKARPFHEGVFGYVWAGARASHGVAFGKICYEVKITEELKWEDLSKQYPFAFREQKRDSRFRTDHRSKENRDRRERKDSEKKSEKPVKNEEKPVENEEKPVENEEKPVENEEKPVENKEKPLENEEKMDTNESDEVKKEEQETDVKQEEEEKKENENAETQEEPKKEEEEKAETEEAKQEPIPTHLIRVGFSLLSTGLQLGECKFSYCYESSGKFVTDKQFADYGDTFGVGDVIGAYLNIDEENVTITYTVNGRLQPTAVTVPRSEFPEENFAVFPHVISRNYVFELNFGGKEEPWFPAPEELKEYQFLEKIEEKVAGPTRPEQRSDCEVIMMYGLPACGKTHWVKQHVDSNPEKRYNVFGNTSLLERMTVSGEPLKKRFGGKWYILVDRLQKCLNRLVDLAPYRRRNFIIDQTNVFPMAQRRKMRPFEGYRRRAVVLVVGDEEQARRQALQETQDGKDVPECSVLELKANMAVPEKGEWLDEVIFAELNEEEAKEMIKKYNADGKQAGYGTKRFYRDDRRGYQQDRNYGRYDRRPWQQNHGGWRDNRRDHRGPPPRRDWGRNGSGRDYGRDYNRHQGGGRGGRQWQGGWGGSSQGWNQHNYGHYNQQGGWQNQGQNWKYGGGQGYGGYGGGSGSGSGGQGNWGYYNQYQNWQQK